MEPREFILEAAEIQRREGLSDEQVAAEMRVSFSSWIKWRKEAQDNNHPQRKWQRESLAALRAFVERRLQH